MEALRTIGEHAGAFASRLEDDGPEVRQAALYTLGALGEHAAPQVDAIAARLEDDDDDVRRAAWKALGKLCEHVTPPRMMTTVGAWR